MMPMIDKLIAEGIKIEKIETWHDEANNERMREYDRGFCGGVPFFYNTETNKWICGETDEESLRAWASA
jgi:hypothetical protein